MSCLYCFPLMIHTSDIYFIFLLFRFLRTVWLRCLFVFVFQGYLSRTIFLSFRLRFADLTTMSLFFLTRVYFTHYLNECSIIDQITLSQISCWGYYTGSPVLEGLMLAHRHNPKTSTMMVLYLLRDPISYAFLLIFYCSSFGFCWSGQLCFWPLNFWHGSIDMQIVKLEKAVDDFI